MYIYLLIHTLQCEQKLNIHESLLKTFNLQVSQLLLCPEWLWCHYKMSFPSHARMFTYTSFHIGGFLFVRYGHKDLLGFSCCIFLVLFIIDFISFASLALYSIIITLTGEERAGLYVVVYQWACTLLCSHFCVCLFGSMAKVICD